MSLKPKVLLAVFVAFTSVLSANFKGPLFNDSLVEVKVTAGQTAILPCTARHKAGHNIIWMSPKRILMSTEEQIVVADGRISVERPFQQDWNLQILRVRHNDSGEYTCQINTSPVKIKRVFLDVQVPAHILNSESSTDMDVEEGDDVNLLCRATGVPPPNITWSWRQLFSTGDKENLNVLGERLTIPNIQRYQSGMYTCLAYNEVHPAVFRNIEVRVEYRPVVKLLNTRLGQSLGKETILDCSVTAYRRAKVQWIKNGVPVEGRFKYRIEHYPGEHDTVSLTLTISMINENDYGDYTCEATNRMGTDRATMVLYEYKPRTPKPPTTVVTRPKTLRPTTTTEYYFYENLYEEQPSLNGDYRSVLSDDEKDPWYSTKNHYYYGGDDLKPLYREVQGLGDASGKASFAVSSAALWITVISLVVLQFLS